MNMQAWNRVFKFSLAKKHIEFKFSKCFQSKEFLFLFFKKGIFRPFSRKARHLKTATKSMIKTGQKQRFCFLTSHILNILHYFIAVLVRMQKTVWLNFFGALFLASSHLYAQWIPRETKYFTLHDLSGSDKLVRELKRQKFLETIFIFINCSRTMWGAFKKMDDLQMIVHMWNVWSIFLTRVMLSENWKLNVTQG